MKMEMEEDVRAERESGMRKRWMSSYCRYAYST
jgi:hypothetical protein